MFRPSLLGALALACAATAALAQDHPRSGCIDIAIPKGAITAADGRWIEVTPEQYRFLQGVYAMDPATPPGLPYGDRAALATIKEHPGAPIWFIDGDQACAPIRAFPAMLDLLADVATGVVSHEGASQ